MPFQPQETALDCSIIRAENGGVRGRSSSASRRLRRERADESIAREDSFFARHMNNQRENIHGGDLATRAIRGGCARQRDTGCGYRVGETEISGYHHRDYRRVTASLHPGDVDRNKIGDEPCRISLEVARQMGGRRQLGRDAFHGASQGRARVQNPALARARLVVGSCDVGRPQGKIRGVRERNFLAATGGRKPCDDT